MLRRDRARFSIIKSCTLDSGSTGVDDGDIQLMAKRNPSGKRHSLKDARHPVLVRQSGERLVAQSELGQLQDKREHLIAQLDEIDSAIMALKKKRQAELMAELEELGLSIPTSRSAGERKLQRQ